MKQAVLVFAIALVITLAIGPAVINYLRKMKFGQKILEIGPKWHMNKQNIPTMGGFMFIIGIAAAVIIGNIVMGEISISSLAVLGLAVAYGAVGLVDDYAKIKKKENAGLTPKQKLVLQILVAGVFILVLFLKSSGLPQLWIPFTGVSFSWPWPLYIVFAAFVIVGADNAVNLTDGIDGLCSCVTVVYMAAFTCIAGILGMFCEGLLALVTAGGCIGFLMWNFPPAKVFMGDTGSMFLGGVVCALGVGCGVEFLMLVAALVYICEALSVVIQVTVFKITKKIYHTKEGKRLFKMTPIHHHFELSGWSELRIDIVFSLTAAVLGACSVLMAVGMFGR